MMAGAALSHFLMIFLLLSFHLQVLFPHPKKCVLIDLQGCCILRHLLYALMTGPYIKMWCPPGSRPPVLEPCCRRLYACHNVSSSCYRCHRTSVGLCCKIANSSKIQHEAANLAPRSVLRPALYNGGPYMYVSSSATGQASEVEL